MSALTYSDEFLRAILREVKTIAVVGASPKADRPSHKVMKYLQDHGYRCIPVNPGQAGGEILGEKCYAALAEIPEKIDLVDVFRASDAVPGVTDEAIAARASVLWLQLGIRHDEAAATAQAAGLKVVMDRCTKIEHARLMGL